MLLHTLIDMARTEAEEASGEGREINHHGKAITVGGPKEDKDTDLLVNRVRRGGGGGVEGGGVEGGVGTFPWLLALGLGATIEKEHAVPRGGEAEGRTDGRRPCARVARERELTLVRALPYPNCSPRKYYLPIKYYAEIVLSPNKILCGDSTISK